MSDKFVNPEQQNDLEKVYENYLEPGTSNMEFGAFEGYGDEMEGAGEVTPPSMMLITGFGMRNADSLQRALLKHDQYKKWLLHKHKKKDIPIECLSISGETSTSSIGSSLYPKESEQEMLRKKMCTLEYLMGLKAPEEEQEFVPPQVKIEEEIAEEVEKETSVTGSTKAKRRAQRYLRNHKIFEFLKFLTAHLLSELPDNPIEFLLDLLDKCLMYRSGIGEPPLLYDKRHLEQLFYLMDRMRTGYIDMAQYKTGMDTLSITDYERNPVKSESGHIAKSTFIDEAYDCLTDIFCELIKRRGNEPTAIVPPPPSAASTWSA